jgi:hypothetical protein
MTPAEFVGFFCRTHRGYEPGAEVTRIEWGYLDWPAPSRPPDDAVPAL